jgi:hypothetical protein
VLDVNLREVTIRVTHATGKTEAVVAPVKQGKFEVQYPRDFNPNRRLAPSVLFVDAIPGRSPTASAETPQAEVTLFLYNSRKKQIPDYPAPFTTDLLDSKGQRDKQSQEWSAVRAMVNLYRRSYGAKLAGVGKPDFDLNTSDDFAFFKNSLALYDFAGRDRDWSKPLANRPKRTFWKSVWNTWFNSSNNHPLDGNPANRATTNYLPYAFTNDFADILIAHLMRLRLTGQTETNQQAMCREALANLIAWQHQKPTNFALPDTQGRQETYTAGAFRYGLFVNGDFMTEGKGWFYNPAFRDYAEGGVLNGRAVWAVGEGLRADPQSPLAKSLQATLARALQFCLHDALSTGYAKKTKAGNIYWRDAGEHAYLVLGMVNACAVVPKLPVLQTILQKACADALNALVDLQKPSGQWAVYPNVDSMAIAALAEGAMVLKNHPNAKRWQQSAEKAANLWMNARVEPSEFRNPVVHFGLLLKPDSMTYRWSKRDSKSWKDHNFIFFYQTGHWTHALAKLFALTGEERYRKRAEAMVSYLCGDNPWGVRLLNEMGGVYNWVEDRDGDGIEDHLKQDMYPESTAFSLIGIVHLLDAIVQQ